MRVCVFACTLYVVSAVVSLSLCKQKKNKNRLWRPKIFIGYWIWRLGATTGKLCFDPNFTHRAGRIGACDNAIASQENHPRAFTACFAVRGYLRSQANLQMCEKMMQCMWAWVMCEITRIAWELRALMSYSFLNTLNYGHPTCSVGHSRRISRKFTYVHQIMKHGWFDKHIRLECHNTLNTHL